jgi:hypothetical protein
VFFLLNGSKELEHMRRLHGLACWLGLCSLGLSGGTPACQAGTFDDDVTFLKKHVQVIVLTGEAGKAQVAVVPDYQGRVMTSTAGGGVGPSFGWLNREAIADGTRKPHINVFGGEDRFWLGPEGGQYSIFFRKGDPFNLETWQTPEAIDWGAWETVSKSPTKAVFRKLIKLTNYSGTEFQLTADRTVRLLPRERVSKLVGLDVGPDLDVVAYESENRITNTGSQAWTKEGGLLSIWILGMYQPSDQTTIVIPFRGGSEKKLGPKVNDAYFGKVPADRLKVGQQHLFFKGDGKSRGKIGVGPSRAKPVLGSYAAELKLLTLVQFNKPKEVKEYVNSMWEIQKEPYAGDVANSYNDGPPEPGKKPMGPFYELETSSPAAALQPGESLTHIHRTMHLQGPEDKLSEISTKVLGVTVPEIASALKANSP